MRDAMDKGVKILAAACETNLTEMLVTKGVTIFNFSRVSLTLNKS